MRNCQMQYDQQKQNKTLDNGSLNPFNIVSQEVRGKRPIWKEVHRKRLVPPL